MIPTILLDNHLPSANLPYLFAAFVVTWAVFFGYVFFVNRRQQELRNEIGRLRRLLEEQDGGAEVSR